MHITISGALVAWLRPEHNGFGLLLPPVTADSGREADQ